MQPQDEGQMVRNVLRLRCSMEVLVMARETAAARAAREWAEIRAIAEAAGYVNPYPEPGTAPVLTIDDRCSEPRCQWSLYVSLVGDISCPNPKCSEHGKVYQEVRDVEPVPATRIHS